MTLLAVTSTSRCLSPLTGFFASEKTVYASILTKRKDPVVKSANIVVRPATKFDLPFIERHYGPLDNIGDPFCDLSKILEIRLDWLLIAEVDGEYAGFLYWHLGRNPFFAPQLENFAHIREVQVLERFQGKGVGRELMLYALDRLKGLGIKEVFLATAETNNVARRLYESLGFEQFRKQIQYSLRIDTPSTRNP